MNTHVWRAERRSLHNTSILEAERRSLHNAVLEGGKTKFTLKTVLDECLTVFGERERPN